MILVLDTVVLVRGLLGPFSRSGRLLFDRFADYEWIVSPDIVEEYFDVIRRPGLMNKYIVAENRGLEVIVEQIASATVVHPKILPAICRDPADDKFLAAADASQADLFVSEDRDLLSLEDYKGTRICTPETALHELDRDWR